MADDPRKTAFDDDAPEGERFDAHAELARLYKPLASEVEQTREFFDDLQMQLQQEQLHKSNLIIPGGYKERRKKGAGMQSLRLDDLEIYIQGDWYEKPSPMGFASLRRMVDQTPVLSAVVLTRIRQVLQFCRPVEQGRNRGFEIRHIDRDHELTKDEHKSIELLTRFVANCGWEFDPRKRKQLYRDTFPGLMTKLVRDSLTMDAAPIELEHKRDKSLGLDGFYAVDGATVYLCTEDGYQGDDSIFALQVLNGDPRTAYTYDDLIYEVRNPQTDVRLAGYGMGETELLIRLVTGWLNALTYNTKGFDENSIPRGLLHLSGDYDKKDLAQFRMYWNAMVKGINNAWSLPVMVSKDQESKASFENFGIEFNEMYFAKWMTFLTSMICAIYGMSPDEINVESFSAQKSSLSGSDTEEKLADSKDKGLRPLLDWLQGTVSSHILADFGDKYVFRWAGLDPEDEEKKHELKKLVLTVNEVRAQEGYEPMDGPLGDAPVNPSLLGAWQQAQQPDDDFGDPDDGDGEQPGQGDDDGFGGGRQVGGPDDGFGGQGNKNTSSKGKESSDDEPPQGQPPQLRKAAPWPEIYRVA